MMKYTIKRKRLPQARIDQVYTLTIYMGHLGNDGSKAREAKVQYPVISHREGLCKYRELKRLQRLLDEQDTFVKSKSHAPILKAPVTSRASHSPSPKKSHAKRSSKQHKQMPVAV